MPATGSVSKRDSAAGIRGLREFEFTNANFTQANALYRALTGMSMTERKSDLVYSRLVRRLRATDSPTFRSYLAKVAAEPAEAEQFVNALTTNLTSFFREEHHFPILAEHATRTERSTKLRVWCAASSTGEEPYSIAMSLAAAYGQTPAPAEIVATDLDTAVLQTARAGIYDESRVATVSKTLLQQFFLRGKGAERGRVRVAPALRDSVSFRQLNLLGTAWPVTGRFDAIFLRNVLIYFDREAQLKTLTRIARLLDDCGLLFTGHSESLFYASHLFRPIGPTVYCKVDSPLKKLTS